MLRIGWVLGLLGLAAMAFGDAPKGALKDFVVKDCLGHAWTDELVSFPFTLQGASGKYMLTDDAGTPVLAQFADVAKGKDGAAGTVWTVATVARDAAVHYYLCPAKGAAPASSLALAAKDNVLTLRNSRLALALPKLPGKLAQPTALSLLPAPFGPLQGDGSGWFGAAGWTGAEGLPVVEATTSVVAQGPVFIQLQQRYLFTDGSSYTVGIRLGERQDAVLITEDYTNTGAACTLTYDLAAGLQPTKLLWHNQWKETPNAKSWSKTITSLNYDAEKTICNLRPWSFWWLGDLTMWAGAYNDAYQLGFLALRPARWTPIGWDGFDKSQCPIVMRPGGKLEVRMPLFTMPMKDDKGVVTRQPLHREWALTVGKTADQANDSEVPALRRQLIKYSEFPLNEVKDFGFEYTSEKTPRTHPFLICSRKDIERVRKQVETVPAVKAQVDEDYTYVINACHSVTALDKGGWEAYYQQCYIGNYQLQKLPQVYLGKDDPDLGRLMAAAVKGMAAEVAEMLLDKPVRPSIGSHGPWFSELPMRLLLNYDLIAGTGVLTPDEEKYIRNYILLATRFLIHPDYWNTDVGLCSANPNMTSSIYLMRGMVGLFMADHPQANDWVKYSEAELQRELKGWIADGGAWIEDPGYQSASLDGIFLLAQALKNVRGVNYFADPQFKATMNYYGFLLTPPDKRFPPNNTKGVPPPMVLPSIGDMFSGYSTLYNGWMARGAADSDPAYSKTQQYFWKKQNCFLGMAGRAGGFALAMTDGTLPDAPPTALSAKFPGFGNVLRTSWTDPRATYVAHRTGEFHHHYHQEFNEIVLNAKGAPLCTDFGNCYAPLQRAESYYHNTVSFDKADSLRKWGNTGKWVDFVTLPKTIDYSAGENYAGGGQHNRRQLLLVKSDDLLGANYVVIRDQTQDGQPNQQFYYNLWCLATDVKTDGNTAHFTGQNGVDLDLTVLSPRNVTFERDQWGFREQIYVWGWFEEHQLGIRVQKSGSTEDYLTVLYPRAAGQGPAQITRLASDAVQVTHMEGTDVILLSPGKPDAVDTGAVALTGEIAYARQYANGTLRLAVVKGDGSAQAGDYRLAAAVPAAVEITTTAITGESSAAGKITLALPADRFAAVKAAGKVTLDGVRLRADFGDNAVTFAVPEGVHSFAIAGK